MVPPPRGSRERARFSAHTPGLFIQHKVGPIPETEHLFNSKGLFFVQPPKGADMDMGSQTQEWIQQALSQPSRGQHYEFSDALSVSVKTFAKPSLVDGDQLQLFPRTV